MTIQQSKPAWSTMRYHGARKGALCFSSRALNAHAPCRAKRGKPSDEAPWPTQIYSSQFLTDRRSTFQAHATRMMHRDGNGADLSLSLSHFLSSLDALPRVKRASHRMYAYRLAAVATGQGQKEGSTPVQPLHGQDDGGESGSGQKLARLLELNDCQNVCLVVFRWYGGVPLGSDRWKRISAVAKEALSLGGFTTRKE